jgi:DNA-binding protein H-NS
MTVRAVDMQTMLPRLAEAGRLQQQVDAQPALTQHAQTAQVAAKAERAQHQVNQKASAEQTPVRKDGGGRGGSGGGPPGERPGGRRPPAEPAKELSVEPGLGHRLDVKL